MDDIADEAARSLTQWLAEPDRICPTLAAPALIRGGVLRMRLGDQEHSIKAPPRFLERLYRWCTGELTRTEIGKLAHQDGLGIRFEQFLDALMDGGLLVDAAFLRTGIAVAQYPSWLGQAAPATVWKQIQAPLPDHLPISASSLPGNVTPLLTGLLAHRRSAGCFGPQAVLPHQLSSLLVAIYGANDGGRRVVASAGGFYRLQVRLVLIKSVGNFAAGAYTVHYDRSGGVGVERIADLRDDLVRAFVQPHRLIDATGFVVLSTDLRLGSLKYRNRIYPYALLEAGAMLQNAALACGEMKIGWRTLGGFEEGRIGQMCQLKHDTPLITGVFGTESVSASPSSRRVEFGWSSVHTISQFYVASARLPGEDHKDGKQCWGRDSDPVRAYDKALAEAVERTAYRLRRDDVEACASQLTGRWLHPNELVRYSAAQYKRAGFPLAKFSSHEPRRWVSATRVMDGNRAWVPADFVFAPTAFESDYRSQLLFHAGSSGCASHVSIELATESALFELAERDAFARHWLAQRSGALVEKRSLPDWIGTQIDALTKENCSTWVHVLQPSGIPTWMVLIRSERLGFSCVGAAAGANPERALTSAFAEAQVGALSRLAGVRPACRRASEVRTPRDHADLHATRRHFRRTDALLSSDPPIGFHQIVSDWPGCFDAAAEILHKRGFGRPHIIDISQADAPSTWAGTRLRTVRILVPGLVPLTFGSAGLPWGMADKVNTGGRFPHPFP